MLFYQRWNFFYYLILNHLFAVKYKTLHLIVPNKLSNFLINVLPKGITLYAKNTKLTSDYKSSKIISVFWNNWLTKFITCCNFWKKKQVFIAVIFNLIIKKSTQIIILSFLVCILKPNFEEIRLIFNYLFWLLNNLDRLTKNCLDNIIAFANLNIAKFNIDFMQINQILIIMFKNLLAKNN